MDDDERGESLQSYSAGTTEQQTGIIHLRLDTSQMLDQLEAFLRGTRLVGYKETEDGIKPLYGPSGVAKLNPEGVQSLMSWLTLHLSPHTVQGNFKAEQFDEYICEFEIDLRQMLMTNLHHWNCKIYDYNTIVDGVMLTVQPFFSRTIDNKERESYMQTLRTVESRTNNTAQSSGGLFGIFKGTGK